jgi:S-formylglutathione hydrolase FrmB
MNGYAARRRALWRRRILALLGLGALAVLARLAVGAVKDLISADTHGADVGHMTIHSKAVGEDLQVAVVVPEDAAAKPPLLVFLHGRSGDEDSNLTEQMYAALADQGSRAPVVAFPDGGDHSYWHDRADGQWAEYVINEVIPQVSDEFGADANRVAIGGISMGGFGALDLARLHPGRFCAVGGHSPALWQTGAETAEGAFDDEADFNAHDVVGAAQANPGPYMTQPDWLDAGDEDPFLPGDDAFTTALEDAGAPITVKHWPGGHEGDYWNDHWDEYMAFYAKALAHCRG